MPVLVDSSALYSMVDRRDPRHADVSEALADETSVIIVAQVALCEVTHLIARRLGGATELAFLAGLAASDWRLEPLEPSDLARVVEILERYADASIGFHDASIVAIAERLGVRRIYTLDRRDFALVRPRHVPSFEILP